MSKLRLLPANKDFYSTAALCSLVNDRLMCMTYSKQVFLHWQCPDSRYKDITNKTCPNNLSLVVYSKKLYKLDIYEWHLRITVHPVSAPERILGAALSALPGGGLVKKHSK